MHLVKEKIQKKMNKASEKFFKFNFLNCKAQNHRLAEVGSNLWRSHGSKTPSLKGDNP